MLKNFSARFARGINHCSAPAAPFCLYTLSRSRIYTKCTAACAVAPEWGSCSRAKTAHYGGAVGLGFMGLGQTMAGQYRADHSPWLKASVPCKWSQVEASGLPHHIIPTLFYFSTAKFSGFDFSPKQKVFSKKKK